MNATELLDHLEAIGVHLVPFEDRLHFHPVGSVSADLIEQLRQHKAELIEIIRERIDAMLQSIGQPPDWRFIRLPNGREALIHKSYRPEEWID